MRRARELIVLLLAALLVLAAAPGRARAGDKDPDALIAFAEALNDYVGGKSQAALKKVNEALKACAGDACEASTRAQLHAAAGIIHGGGLKDAKKAVASFEEALREDPKITPDKQFMNPALNKLFAEAQKNVKKGAAPGRPPPSKPQLEAAAQAEKQLAQKDWSSCMGTIIAAMTDSEFALGKLVLAQCEDTGGLLLEATNDAKLAQKYAEEEGNADLKKRAADLLAKLANDTPSILVQIPRSIDEPELFVDGVAVPRDAADKPIPHNPGKATIEVKGKRGSFPFTFKTTESFDRGERVTVNVEQAAGQASSAVFQCIQAARTPADVSRCIETGGKGRGLTFRGGLEVASYNDNVSVDVLSPTLFFSFEHPTQGWQVGGSYTVDVVSTASPDIVAMASRRFDEVRHAGALGAEVKIGPARVGVNGAVSVEPDYMGRNVGGSVSADFHNKQVTPTLAYHVGFDILGRAHTPYAVFSRNITTHSIDASTSVITSPSTIFLVAGTAELVLGDTSKPYRHIPMFAPGVAEVIPRGAVPSLVGAERLPVDPLEQLPDKRYRFAVLGRVAHRFEASTLRADERLYVDTWGLKASTTDARWLFDVTKALRVGPHLRFHIQSPVDFWQRAYTATPSSAGWQLPRYRAGDRELGPLFGVTLGGSIRYALTEQLAIQVQAEGIYTQFLDSIYVYDRWALFTASTFEVTIE